MQTTRLWRSGVFSSGDHVLALPAAIAEFGDGRRRVVQQARAILRIAPGARDDAGAVARPDLVLVGLDDRVERRRIDIALFDQQRFERAHAQRDFGEFGMVVVMVAHASTRGFRACTL